MSVCNLRVGRGGILTPFCTLAIRSGETPTSFNFLPLAVTRYLAARSLCSCVLMVLVALSIHANLRSGWHDCVKASFRSEGNDGRTSWLFTKSRYCSRLSSAGVAQTRRALSDRLQLVDDRRTALRLAYAVDQPVAAHQHRIDTRVLRFGDDLPRESAVAGHEERTLRAGIVVEHVAN